jgi:hypothetical protein
VWHRTDLDRTPTKGATIMSDYYFYVIKYGHRSPKYGHWAKIGKISKKDKTKREIEEEIEKCTDDLSRPFIIEDPNTIEVLNFLLVEQDIRGETLLDSAKEIIRDTISDLEDLIKEI